MKPQIYIFKLTDETFRGIVAYSEDQAREVGFLRNYEIKELVRTEDIAVDEIEQITNWG